MVLFQLDAESLGQGMTDLCAGRSHSDEIAGVRESQCEEILRLTLGQLGIV